MILCPALRRIAPEHNQVPTQQGLICLANNHGTPAQRSAACLFVAYVMKVGKMPQRFSATLTELGTVQMPKIDLDRVPLQTGSGYPKDYAKGFEKRGTLRVGDAGGLTQFGANIVVLQPGGRSSLRHWHTHQDEFVLVISGELTLIDDSGETELVAGECCAFPAGDENGHTIANNSGQEGTFLVVGTRSEYELAYYSDIDMKVELTDGKFQFTRKDGSAI